MFTLNGNAVRIPRWFFVVLAAILALLGSGYAVGTEVRETLGRLDVLEIRLCRIERALEIDPWPSCPER